MRRLVRLCAATVLSAVPHTTPMDISLADQKPIAGYAEHIWLPGISTSFPAKLDTGAHTSSIHAINIHEFQRNEEAWARFTISKPPLISRPIEARVVRTARVKRAGVAAQQRTVVNMKICIAGITAVTEFTLTDRSGMDYPILIGRSFLKGRLLVDAGATDIANRGCGAEKW